MATNSDKIDFSRTIHEMKTHWYYFLISFIIVMGGAIYYSIRTNPVFAFHANVLIEQPQEGGSGGGLMKMMASFSMGAIGGGSVDDELLVFQSISLQSEMVRELKLNYDYRKKQGARMVSLYKKSPILLSTDIDLDTLSESVSFLLKLHRNGTVDVKVKDGLFSTCFDKKGLRLPASVKLSSGTFRLSASDAHRPSGEMEMEITVDGTPTVVDDLQGIFIANAPSMKSNGIELYYEDDDIQRGKDVLNTIIQLYNNRRLDEERVKANNQIAFIDSRLESLTQQLNEAERDLEKFKTENNVTDIEAEAKVLLEQTSANKASIVGLQTQLAIFDMICDFLDDPANRYSMIPVTSGVEYESAAKSIEAYNELILARMKLDMSAKKDNKALQTINRQIDGMREGVVTTMKKARESAEIAYNDFVREDGKYAVRLRELPAHEREYINLYRNQEIMNNLYAFLLEQRENNGLKLGASPLGRTIDHAYNDIKKIAPKRSIILGGALLIALLIPAIICMIKALRLKRIKIRQDVEKISDFPIALEIDSQADTDALFRKLRNHIVSARDSGVISFTTCTSDGDTTQTALATALSLAKINKRTIVVDLIHGNPIATQLQCDKTPHLSDCLRSGEQMDAAIAHGANGIDVVPAGSEEAETDLVVSSKFASFIGGIKTSYDYVIISGGTFDEYRSLPSVAKISDLLFGIIPPCTLKQTVARFDAELKQSGADSEYILYVK